MSYQFQHSADNSLVRIKSEQLNEIIAAILAGKYSWACFLLLRCVGYNPLDYIPYRTSHRLLQQNSKSTVKMKSEESKSDRNKIADLDYLEPIEEKRTGIKGGYLTPAFDNLSTDTPDFVPELDCEKQDIWMMLNIKGVQSQNQSFLGRTKIRLFNTIFARV